MGDYKIDLNDVLGQGSFGSVFKASRNDHEFAVKLLLKHDEHIVENLRKTVQIEHHKNIATHYDIIVATERGVYVILSDW